MKPRLQSAQLTPEDKAVWSHVWGHWTISKPAWCPHIFILSQESDRRDAELMLHLRRAYEDIKPYIALQRYRRVWFSACAFQGIPIVT